MTFATIGSADTIHDIAGPWRSTARTLYEAPGWLATSEGAGNTRYLIVEPATGQAGPLGLVMQRLDGSGWPMADPVALLSGAGSFEGDFTAEERAALTEARGHLPDPASLYPVTTCLLPGGYTTGIVGRAGQSTASLSAALDAFEAQATAWGAETVAAMHVPDDDTALTALLTRRGYVPFTAVADCVLPLPFTSFPDYLASLPPTRRRKVRREMRSFQAAGYQVRLVGLDDVGPDHVQLHVDHMTRYGHSLTADKIAALLARIRDHLAPFTRVLEARNGDRLAGFVLFYEDDTSLYPKMLGFLPQTADKAFIYFNLGYYELISYAVARGIPQLVLGPESYEAKALRGARPAYRTTYVRPSPAVRDAVTLVARRLDRAYRRHISAQPWTAHSQTGPK